MMFSIENIQVVINHRWIMFSRYYDKTNTARCRQFCKKWAPLTSISGALCFFIIFQLEKMLWVVL